MADSGLRASQLSMGRFLRNPQQNPPPPGVEPRRLKIYQDLVYNNIEGFISGGFPVLRSLYEDAAWHALVRAFIAQHSCHTPYFLEISQEFLQFLMHDYQAQEHDPPFLAELAHYEWVELALDVSPQVLPDAVEVEDVLATVVQLSPLAWSLCYHYPVHRIGPGFRPSEQSGPTYLAVYRDRADTVRFMALNSTTARLLELLRDNRSHTAKTLLETLAGELGQHPAAILAHGSDQLRQWLVESVVVVTNS